jgi:hypothetical protein
MKFQRDKDNKKESFLEKIITYLPEKALHIMKYKEKVKLVQI